MKNDETARNTSRNRAEAGIGDARSGRSAFLPAFTLLELMIALGLFGLVVAGSFGVYGMCRRMWRATSLKMDTARIAGMAVQRMVYGVGNNSGLRAAARIWIETNWHNAVGFNYWDSTTNSPPAAGNAVNNLEAESPDGSWRIVYSNDLEGVKFIDYAKGQRSIVLWPQTNQAAGRLLIANYVLSVRVVTNSTGGIEIENLTVWKKDGDCSVSNRVSTFVNKRNK